jgi:hypothetical protein
MHRMIGRFLAILSMAALPVQPALAQACHADTRPPFETFVRTAIPVGTNNANFVGYPATAFAAQLSGRNGPRFGRFLQPASPNGQQRFATRWVNRCHDFTSGSVPDLGHRSRAPTGEWQSDQQAVRKCRNRPPRPGENKGNYPEVRVPAGQDVPAGIYRFHFSTVARADACTMAQTYTNFGAADRGRRLIADAQLMPFDLSSGMPNRLPAEIAARALPVIARRQSYDPFAGIRTANGHQVFDPRDFRNARGFLDVCATEYAAGIDRALDGIIFDWEVADDRSIMEGSHLADRIHRALRDGGDGEPDYCRGRWLCQPKIAMLRTHAWDDPDGRDVFRLNGRTQPYVRNSSQRRDGLGPGNAAYVRARFDIVTIELSSHSRSRTRDPGPGRDLLLDSEILASLDEQERVLGIGPQGEGREQLMAMIGFGSIALDDARLLRRELDRRGYRHIFVWQYLQPGDSLRDCNGTFQRNLSAFLAG